MSTLLLEILFIYCRMSIRQINYFGAFILANGICSPFIYIAVPRSQKRANIGAIVCICGAFSYYRGDTDACSEERKCENKI